MQNPTAPPQTIIKTKHSNHIQTKTHPQNKQNPLIFISAPKTSDVTRTSRRAQHVPSSYRSFVPAYLCGRARDKSRCCGDIARDFSIRAPVTVVVYYCANIGRDVYCGRGLTWPKLKLPFIVVEGLAQRFLRFIGSEV